MTAASSMPSRIIDWSDPRQKAARDAHRDARTPKIGWVPRTGFGSHTAASSTPNRTIDWSDPAQKAARDTQHDIRNQGHGRVPRIPHGTSMLPASRR